jgi:soluble lytic murein transglycosylase-like protein
MSVESTVARVAQLQALMNGGPAAMPATQPAKPGAFQQELQRAGATQPGGAVSTPGTANPTAPATGGGSPTRFDGMINAAAARHGVPPALLKGLIRAESNFNPNAQSPAGAQGLCQLMPMTARSLGVTNPLDPKQSIEGGAKYLGQQLKAFGGDVQRALAAYNAGPGAVVRYGGIPPYAETQNYVKRVLEYARGYGYGGT